MKIQYYFEKYIQFPEALIFFALSLLLVILANVILYCFSIAGSKKYADKQIENKDMENVELSQKDAIIAKENLRVKLRYGYIYNRFMSYTQSFYEIIFSGNCILFFMTAYYLIYRFYDVQPLKTIFLKYDSYFLLVMIILSCILNTILDRVLVKLDHIKQDERSSIKILGMLYMLIIFGYIKFIYENDNYDMYITYFISLMVGRFVYFDASFKDFFASIKKAGTNIPIMLLSLLCVACMAYYGFTTKYLIKHIGVVTNVFISHIFLCVSIFIVFHLHPEKWFCPKFQEKA